jgi:hypothetical protein
MNFFTLLAEERIEKALREGAFEELPGAGKPLEYEDDSQIPEELRMAYKILKNSGHIPPELEDRKEIQTLTELLASCPDEQTRYRQIQKINALFLRYNIRYNRLLRLEDERYYERVVERVRVEKPKVKP